MRLNRKDKNDTPISIITPSSGNAKLGLSELFAHSELIGVMVWREIMLRYKQTVIGWGWALIQPLITMLVFIFVFDKTLKVDTQAPYMLFSLSGLIIWIYFSHSVTKSTICLVGNIAIIRKISFPRAILPLAAVLGGLMDFIIMFILFCLVLIFYQVPITLQFMLFPLFLLMIIITALGLGFYLSATNLKYRDVSNLMPFLLQTGLFITPIGYPLAQIDEKWHWVVALNPLVGAIEGFRWSLLGESMPDPWLILISIAISVILFVTGLRFFKRKEAHFGDII